MALAKFLCIILVLQCINVLLAADESIDPATPRKCYTCEGINCQRVTKANATIDCGNLLDICVTVFDGYTVAAKGCLEDIPERHRSKCTHDNPECSKCFGQLCNTKGRVDYKCVVCDSKDQFKCLASASELSAERCDIPTGENSYCYVKKTDTNYISRGCSIHVQEQMDCLADKSCSLCLASDGVACNTYELNILNSSAAKSLLAFIPFSLLLIVNLFK